MALSGKVVAAYALLAGGLYWALRPRTVGTLTSGKDEPGYTGDFAPGDFTLRLNSQAFPADAHPGVLVHVPPGVTDSAPQVTVYYHGHNTNVPVVASRVVPAFDAARRPGVLVIPQLKWNVATGDPGQLGTTGGLARLLDEAFQSVPALRSWRAAETTVDVMAHSGGYVAAAKALTHGGVSVRNVALFDALYGETPTFTTFARNAAIGGRGRFVNLYGASTLANSETMARALQSSLGDRLYFDPAGHEVGVAQLLTRAAIVRTRVAHGDVGAVYLARVREAFATL